jgi:EmrB/QacA subfamily drug resistance transporter
MSKDAVQPTVMERSSSALDGHQHRWTTLVLCLGILMIVVDGTVANVALPSIRQDLQFSQTSLVWVVNAYMLTYGSFLLLAGRLGDIYGHRKLFLIGIALFTVASCACGFASTRGMLIAARAVQGIGGASVVAVALSLIMNLFKDTTQRAKALGIYGFVSAIGGSVGLLVGGTLTSLFGWHWIFFINLPIGIAVYVWCVRFLPNAGERSRHLGLDLWGAATVTASLMLAVYAVLNANDVGWTSTLTLSQLTVSAAMLVAFIFVEVRTPTPLVPLRIFRFRALAVANAACVLCTAGAWAWFFVAALYMQTMLGFGPMQIALAFLPANVITAAFAVGLSARMVARFGIRTPLGVGLGLSAIGLALFGRAPVHGSLVLDVLPGMLLLGVGRGMSFNPLLLAAMRDVGSSESGLASGVINTSSVLGGALGLAIFGSLSAARANELLASGSVTEIALTGGYRIAFLLGALFTAVAAVMSTALLRSADPIPELKHAESGTSAPVISRHTSK